MIRAFLNKNLKTLAFFMLVLALSKPVLAAQPQPVTRDMMDNYLLIELGEGDRATIYFNDDNTLLLMPSFTNKKYVHMCWAKWNLNEKSQKFKMHGGRECRIINGDYTIQRIVDKYTLRDGSKRLLMRQFLSK